MSHLGNNSLWENHPKYETMRPVYEYAAKQNPGRGSLIIRVEGEQMKQSHDLWTRGCSLMLLLAGFLVSAGAWAGGVAIDSASWDSRYHPNELYIRGSGEDRSEISIYDADSDVLIDKVTASERGSWRYSASNPSSIPCRVRAESRGERDTRSVSNADSFLAATRVILASPNRPISR